MKNYHAGLISEDPTQYITNIMKKTGPIGHYKCASQNKHGGHTYISLETVPL